MRSLRFYMNDFDVSNSHNFRMYGISKRMNRIFKINNR